MSEDEDVPGGEGWRHLELSWRSDELTKFFRGLDERTELKKKEHMSERTKRTHFGISTLRPPKNAPAWAINPTLVDETAASETPLSRNRGRGRRGIRVRGGRSLRDARGSANRRTDNGQTTVTDTAQLRRGLQYSAQDVLDKVCT